jgi:hypothetical protein
MTDSRPELDSKVTKLSKLQRAILLEGLRASWLAPLGRARGNPRLDSFDIGKILEGYFGVDKRDVLKIYTDNRRDGRLKAKLASPRASISRACSRLCQRGLLEPSRRPVHSAERDRSPYSRWRLTLLGLDVARTLYPLLEGPGPQELSQKIAKIFYDRQECGELSLSLSLKDFTQACLHPTQNPAQPKGLGLSEREGLDAARPKGVQVSLDLSSVEGLNF